MFCRALLQQSRQFSSRTFAAAAKPSFSIVLPSIRQCAPTLSRGRFMSTEASPEKAAEELKPETAAAAASNGNGNGDIKAELEALKKELEKKTEEAKDFKDKFTRTVADFRNLQDRTERDKKAAKDYAIQKFAKDLVDSVDNLDRALSAVPEESRADSESKKELVDLYNGLKMTESILLSTLKKHGLEKIDPIGEAFDPNRHEAMFQVPMADKEPGEVFHVQQTGFALNGRTIRAAKVGVVAAP
ncbi:GrpE-domain-containing protein [Morchella snyderi]|nr:GrpE-domain-containing protein [Morchella snyderi]